MLPPPTPEVGKGRHQRLVAHLDFMDTRDHLHVEGEVTRPAGRRNVLERVNADVAARKDQSHTDRVDGLDGLRDRPSGHQRGSLAEDYRAGSYLGHQTFGRNASLFAAPSTRGNMISSKPGHVGRTAGLLKSPASSSQPGPAAAKPQDPSEAHFPAAALQHLEATRPDAQGSRVSDARSQPRPAAVPSERFSRVSEHFSLPPEVVGSAGNRTSRPVASDLARETTPSAPKFSSPVATGSGSVSASTSTSTSVESPSSAGLKPSRFSLSMAVIPSRPSTGKRLPRLSLPSRKPSSSSSVPHFRVNTGVEPEVISLDEVDERQQEASPFLSEQESTPPAVVEDADDGGDGDIAVHLQQPADASVAGSMAVDGVGAKVPSRPASRNPAASDCASGWSRIYERITLTQKDMDRTMPHQFLNDNLIEMYVAMLRRHPLLQPVFEHVAVLPTYLFSQYQKPSMQAILAPESSVWSKKAWFIPVHEHNSLHWTLIVVGFPNMLKEKHGSQMVTRSSRTGRRRSAPAEARSSDGKAGYEVDGTHSPVAEICSETPSALPCEPPQAEAVATAAESDDSRVDDGGEPSLQSLGSPSPAGDGTLVNSPALAGDEERPSVPGRGPFMLFMDSMGSVRSRFKSHNTRRMRDIFIYVFGLENELADQDRSSFLPSPPFSVPQQTNGSDCGCFVLCLIERFCCDLEHALHRGVDVSQEIDGWRDNTRRGEWFSEHTAFSIRWRLEDMLRCLRDCPDFDSALFELPTPECAEIFSRDALEEVDAHVLAPTTGSRRRRLPVRESATDECLVVLEETPGKYPRRLPASTNSDFALAQQLQAQENARSTRAGAESDLDRRGTHLLSLLNDETERKKQKKKEEEVAAAAAAVAAAAAGGAKDSLKKSEFPSRGGSTSGAVSTSTTSSRTNKPTVTKRTRSSAAGRKASLSGVEAPGSSLGSKRSSIGLGSDSAGAGRSLKRVKFPPTDQLLLIAFARESPSASVPASVDGSSSSKTTQLEAAMAESNPAQTRPADEFVDDKDDDGSGDDNSDNDDDDNDGEEFPDGESEQEQVGEHNEVEHLIEGKDGRQEGGAPTHLLYRRHLQMPEMLDRQHHRDRADRPRHNVGVEYQPSTPEARSWMAKPRGPAEGDSRSSAVSVDVLVAAGPMGRMEEREGTGDEPATSSSFDGWMESLTTAISGTASAIVGKGVSAVQSLLSKSAASDVPAGKERVSSGVTPSGRSGRQKVGDIPALTVRPSPAVVADKDIDPVADASPASSRELDFEDHEYEYD